MLMFETNINGQQSELFVFYFLSWVQLMHYVKCVDINRKGEL